MGRFDNYKFHPSSLGAIMTDSRTKEPIGETCKKHLVECYVTDVYEREKPDKENKYIKKGNQVEEDAITLYSLVTKTLYIKNEEQIENDFFIGTPDLFLGPEIRKATEVKDIKSSWDIFTFFGVVVKATNENYKSQLHGYMDLTGAAKSGLVYVLVNTPRPMIDLQKYYLSRNMGVIDDFAHPEYKAAAEQLEKLSVYDDIPIEKRYIEIPIERDADYIEKAHARVIACRELMNSWT